MKYRTNKTNRLSGSTMNYLTRLMKATTFMFVIATPMVVQAASDFQGTLKGVSITDAGATNQPPVAIITYTQNSNTFTFDASESYDHDGNILGYFWNFGDGNSSTSQVVEHTFSSENTFPVQLSVTDNLKAITILEERVSTIVNTGPVTIAIDDFNTYPHGTNLSSTENWALGFGTAVTLSSNTVRGNDNYKGACAYWNTDIFKNDQYSEVTIYNTTSGYYQGAIVRYTEAGFYGVRTNGISIDIFEWNASNQGNEITLLQSTPYQIKSNDKLKIEVTGSLLSVRVNNNTIIESQKTNLNLESGRPGIYFNSSNGDATITHWAGGNI